MGRGGTSLQLRKDKKVETMEYNGWSNRETWATMLHIDNDQWLHETARDYARRELEEYGEQARYELAQTLQNWIEEDLLTLENVADNKGLWLMLTDIGSLYRVNWKEIADSLIENAEVFSPDDDVETVAWSSSNPTGERLSNV